MTYPCSAASATIQRVPRLRICGRLLVVIGLIAPLFSLAVRAQSAGREWYVAPNGASTNDGSVGRPLDLVTALSSSGPARPGDTIWLRGGTYTGNFTSTLAGTSSAPIVVRQYPRERATIDGAPNLSLPGLTVGGSDAWYWDFEVTNSNPQRLQTARNAGVNVFGPRTKFIDLIVHDAGLGFGVWSSAVDAEVYGSVIYNIGWEDTSQGTGHSIYTQSDTGIRRLTDNILFNGFSYGIHAYTEGGAINNMDWEGNVAFNHGVLSAKSGAKANFLLGGGQVAHNAVILNNYLYQSPGIGGRHLDLGYGTPCDGPTVQGNYVAGSAAPIVLNCTNAVVTGNTFIGNVPSAIQAAQSNNIYLATPPTGLHTVVRPNRYEAGRGHVIIYNWDKLSQVSVDVSALGLVTGDAFEVRDAQNYFAGPVSVGVYSGAAVQFPMTGLTVAAPIGNAPITPPHTAPEFAVFVVKRVAGDPSKIPPTATLAVSPASIATGQDATLSWSSALATSVSIDQGVGPVQATGALTVRPLTTTIYRLTASNAFGTVTSSATVTVSAPGTATFVRGDSTTQGNWKGVYGADGYSLAMDAVSLPSYAQVALIGQSEWVWLDNTSDVRALQKAAGGGGKAATWFASPTFSIDVTVTDGRSHSVALYMLDWDKWGRSQTIDVTDAVTNTVLNSRSVRSFLDGQYLVWDITERVRFRVTSNSGPNAVISGIFFDAPGGGPSPPPSAVPTGSLNATPLTIAPGQSSTLSWSTSNATSVSLDQGIGSVSAIGSLTVAPSATTTYTLTAQNSAGAVTGQRTVTVTPLPTASLSVTPSVTVGQPATLSWSTSNATSIVIDQGIGAVAATGSRTVTPSVTTTYVLTASNAVGTVSASGTVTVVPSPPPTPTPASARFVRTDSATQGSWMGAYGADGYRLATAGAALPGYAQANLGGQANWVWSATTSDMRGLQNTTGSNRFAATWYSGTSFFIDVTIGDGNSHAVALYMLDWDSSTRVQTIDVLDAATNVVLDSRAVATFQNGRYVVWQVSGAVRFRVTRNSGANAVVSGIFFDAPGGAPSPPPPAVPTASLNATPLTIAPGQSATLSWSTSNATSISIDQGIGPVAATGSRTVTPSATTRYVLTASNAVGAVSASGTVTVSPSPPPIPTPASARFVRTDSATQGSWKGTYGAEGHSLASDGTALPGYAQLSFSGKSDYVWADNVSDVRALQKAAASGRIAPAWYSGTSFFIDVTIGDGTRHPVALYMLDWDTPGYRVQNIDVIDRVTNAVLDSRSVANFRNGVYVVWQVSGSVRFRVTLSAGANAVVSGVFFGAP